MEPKIHNIGEYDFKWFLDSNFLFPFFFWEHSNIAVCLYIIHVCIPTFVYMQFWLA